jgi:hypothetical protein
VRSAALLTAAATLAFASGCSGSGSAAPVSGVEKPDPVRLQRVVDVMQQFLGFNSTFNINSMLIGG